MRLSLLAALLFAALPAWSQAQPPGWIADARSGCRVWNPDPQPKETISWSGACSNGLAQGRGMVQWFEEGKPTGSYDGAFRDGRAYGRGVSTFASGNRYDGEFRDGKRNGRGVFTFANGDRYDGEWRDSKPNGLGTYTKGDQVYSGTWTNGCFRQGDRRAMLGATAADCGFR